MSRKRVLLIGLDGATWKTLGPLLKNRKLPNIKKLIDSGTSGTLRSTFNPMSPPAWCSAVTGVNPGKHGVFDFFKHMGGSYAKTVITPGDLRAPAIWDIAGEGGKTVGVVNFPVLYPPVKVKGFFVSGMLTPNDSCEYTYPHELKKEILRNVGKHTTEVPDIKMLGNKKKYFKTLMETEWALFNTTHYLLNNKNWDFFMVVFPGHDRMCHYLFSDFYPEHPLFKSSELKDSMETYLNTVDGFIGKLVGSCGDDTTVIIMSDHGFKPVNKYFNVNKWLEKKGFLKTSPYTGGYMSFYDSFLKKTGLISLLYKIYFKIKSAGIITGLPVWLMKFLPGKNDLLDYGKLLDWGSTRAYYFLGGMIRINRKGREPQGCVSEEEYESLRDGIINSLRSVKDGGKQVVMEVNRIEDVYSGPFLSEAPDIIFRTADGYLNSGFGEDIFEDIVPEPGNLTGHHDPEGIVIISGSGVKKKKDIKLNIVDIAPTVLTLMDLAVPEDMEGSSLFTPNSKKRKKTMELSREQSNNDKLEVIDRLSRLGYID